MGYVGPSVVNRLRASYPGATLVGFDIGYFGSCITGAEVLPECKVDIQYFGGHEAISSGHPERRGRDRASGRNLQRPDRKPVRRGDAGHQLSGQHRFGEESEREGSQVLHLRLELQHVRLGG